MLVGYMRVAKADGSRGEWHHRSEMSAIASIKKLRAAHDR